MPKATFQISGTIEDFDRIDNLYKTMKREGAKLLNEWEIKFDIDYVETQGEGEIP